MIEDDDQSDQPDLTELPDEGARGRVLDAMLETWGERCPDFAEECDACLAWAEYDSLMRARLFHIVMHRLKEEIREQYLEAMSKVVKH